MRVTLEVRSGPDSGSAVAVPPGYVVTVGRRAPADLVIAGDPTLSRSHLALDRTGPTCRVRDLGSTSGTYLNGEPVTEATLADGDVIEAGSTTLVVRIREGAPAPPAPRPAPRVSRQQDAPTEEIEVDEGPIDRVLRLLRACPEPLFAILDAARDPLVLVRAREAGELARSLYEAPTADQLAESAPYLVALPPGSPLLEMLVREGWGKSWGVYLTSAVPFDEVRKHLRRFLIVRDEAGKQLYFRFYDPRVLRVYLGTCLPAELADFFGPIAAYVQEGPDGAEMLEFRPDGRRLKTRAVPLAEARPC